MTTILPVRLPDSNVTIGGFSPSDPLIGHRLERAASIVRHLRQFDISVSFSSHALQSDDGQSVAAAMRASDIHDLALDVSVHALIGACGGKASSQLLDLLDYRLLAKARKPIIGFSDVGVILNAITAKTGLVTFYGPNVLSKLNESKHSNLSALRTGVQRPVENEHAVQLVPGTAEGRLVGGNLSTFTIAISGTGFEPIFDSTILFWESGTRNWRDIGQYLTALHLRGTLGRIKGMLIGKIGDCYSLSDSERRFLLQFLAHLNIPILFSPFFGHGPADNPPLPIGGAVQLTHRGLSFLERLVE